MLIGETDLTPTLGYTAVPSISKSTYVLARLRNLSDFPLLPGKANIYINGSFIGKSDLDLVAKSEKFALFFGLEDRIKVTRELDARKSSTSSWRNKKRLEIAYVIIVKNFMDKPITVEVKDQIPVSQSDGVDIRMLELEPEAQKVEKGVITWPVTLENKGSAKLYFKFRVDYPLESKKAVQDMNVFEKQIQMSK